MSDLGKKSDAWFSGYDYTRDWLSQTKIDRQQAENDLQTMMVDLVGRQDVDEAYEGALAAVKDSIADQRCECKREPVELNSYVCLDHFIQLNIMCPGCGYTTTQRIDMYDLLHHRIGEQVEPATSEQVRRGAL